MKTVWRAVAVVLLIWNGVGFFVGFLVGDSARRDGHYTPNSTNGLNWVDEGKSGCIYNSYASFINPGYVLSCELFRKRFEYESVGKALKELK